MSRLNIEESHLFSSVSEWADWIAKTPRYAQASDASTKPQQDRWDGGMDYAKALSTARQGGFWAEGSKLLMEHMEISNQFAARVPMPRIKRELAGGAPCVGAHLMGHPKAMFKRERTPAMGKPILSIAIVMSTVFSATAEQKLNRGAAIMTAVAELEAQGYRCEVTALHRTMPDRHSPMGTWANIEVLIKKADDKFNPASVAFMIAHAASHRRLMFASLERSGKAGANITREAYGYAGASSSLTNSLTHDFDIQFGTLTPALQRRVDTPAKAFEYVRGEVEKQLGRMAEGAGQKQRG